jgi:hypothetical protein
MNNFRKLMLLSALAAVIFTSAFAVRAQVQAKAGSDEFFVISSIDKAHSALVLLRPTQITATIGVNDKTKYVDENGKSIKMTDLRTGDTIFVTYSTQNNALSATNVRKGMMTTAEMRKRYLPGLPITTSPKGLGH